MAKFKSIMPGIEWKSMASGDYALGLEPSTTALDENFKFSKIGKQTRINFEINIKVESI